MIPKKELRVGNWVITNENEYLKIETGKLLDQADEFSPVAISDFILKQCGFTYDSYFKKWQLRRNLPQSGFDMELDEDYNLYDFSNHFTGVTFQSLHQMQNVFYALKGREIEMNFLMFYEKSFDNNVDRAASGN